MDVISAYQQVGTYRGAASMCGVNHKTVKRIIERQESGGSKTPDRKPRDHNYESVAALAADRVAVTRGRISAKRLPAAGAAGYQGSANDYYRALLVRTSVAFMKFLYGWLWRGSRRRAWSR
jgi:hypothetical protein